MYDKIEVNKVLDNIKILRSIKGVKADEVARGLGITKSSYSDIETGKSELTLSRLQKIADILKVNYSTILHAHADTFQYFTNSPNVGTNNINQNPLNVDLLQSLLKTQESIASLIEKISQRF